MDEPERQLASDRKGTWPEGEALGFVMARPGGCADRQRLVFRYFAPPESTSRVGTKEKDGHRGRFRANSIML
jgi:hypothetical protein